MMIEVLFYDHVGKYQRGQVAEVEDGIFLRAILKNGMADVVNPPDWTPESHDAKIQESLKVTDITKPKRQRKVVISESN
jgi:hypothetical protein